MELLLMLILMWKKHDLNRTELNSTDGVKSKKILNSGCKMPKVHRYVSHTDAWLLHLQTHTHSWPLSHSETIKQMALYKNCLSIWVDSAQKHGDCSQDWTSHLTNWWHDNNGHHSISLSKRASAVLKMYLCVWVCLVTHTVTHWYLLCKRTDFSTIL